MPASMGPLRASAERRVAHPIALNLQRRSNARSGTHPSSGGDNNNARAKLCRSANDRRMTSASSIACRLASWAVGSTESVTDDVRRRYRLR